MSVRTRMWCLSAVLGASLPTFAAGTSTPYNATPVSQAAPAPAPAPAAAPAPAPAPAPLAAPAPAPILISPLTTPIAGYPYSAVGCCDTCAPACCPCPCGPAGKYWVSGEYLYWATRGNPLPALVTTSPAGTPLANAGVLGTPGAVVVGGNEMASNNLRPGFRINAGMWLNCDQTCGIEAGYFMLGNPGANNSFSSPGSPILSRPFFNASTGVPDAELVAFPGVLAGSVNVDSSSKFSGYNVTPRNNLCCTPCNRIDLIYGYQNYQLDDEVTITEALTNTSTTNGVPLGTQILVQDRFRTENTFHGAKLGLAGEWRQGRAYWSMTAAIAAGVMHQVVDIQGFTSITVPGGAPSIRTGGLLAQPTNIGRYTRDEFAVAPQFGLRAGLQVTDHLRAFVGYDFIYLSNVARAGDQIDLVVNPTQIPPGTLVGPARPAPLFNTTDFWAQGVSAGLEFRY